MDVMDNVHKLTKRANCDGRKDRRTYPNHRNTMFEKSLKLEFKYTLQK